MSSLSQESSCWHPARVGEYCVIVMKSALLASALAFALCVPSPGGGESRTASGPEDLRVGISIGGMSLVGILFEYRWGDRSLDLQVGTWTFRDLAVSVAGKQYFGPEGLRPFTGLGLWAVLAPTSGFQRQTGVALVLRAPVGLDWNLDADHHLGAALNINRALWIRRKDPADETPPRDRLIPLPGFYYRWKR